MTTQFRAGIIGCGGISALHAGNYESSPRATLAAVADISQAALDRMAEQHPGVRTYQSAEEMLQTEALDLVSVCTPATRHVEPALLVAASRVRGMLLEKPMALNLQDADRILQACARNQVKLAIGHQLRCAAPYSTARRLVQAGAIGQVERIWGICHRAPLQTNATHTIDLLRFLCGDDAVTWVMGAVSLGVAREYEGMRQEDAGLGFFQFASGPIGLIESGHLEPNRGYHHIYIDGTDGQLELTRPGGPALRLRSMATGGAWSEPELDPELNPVDDFIEAIECGGEARSSGLQGRATLEVILALFESARTHERVPLPLQTSENPLAQILGS